MAQPKTIVNPETQAQTSARMFKSDWLEALSKVHPVTPLIIYTPLIIFYLYQALISYRLGVAQTLLFFILGVFIWSLTEYILHRFLFHHEFKSKLGRRFHFIMHGVHHDYPKDALRLVMPPSISLPLAVLFYYLFKVIIGAQYVIAFFPGFVAGYLFYDMTHFAIHHFNFNNKYWKAIKTHHMKHHYQDPDNGFGVSSVLWDYIFNTYKFRKKQKK